ncbi:DUF3949 domain-containing protein [Bacillus litorisediminis]|uniref:DUF3949 domain-containing protein n=1 Tax=Bacillus litorisediminis TaxID=2922713 RepID=UPI001FABD245|nr:DUF3949 domain-containing protein [Bacillus litorisediminis]
MGVNILLGILAAYILLSFALLPMQYRYIKELKEMDKRRKELELKQDEYFETMSFETQQLHFHAQGSILFIGANLMAELLYNWKHKK